MKKWGDYVSELQELLQQKRWADITGGRLPRYEKRMSRAGNEFVVRCTVFADDVPGYVAEGRGRAVKAAKHQAAKRMLEVLRRARTRPPGARTLELHRGHGGASGSSHFEDAAGGEGDESGCGVSGSSASSCASESDEEFARMGSDCVLDDLRTRDVPVSAVSMYVIDATSAAARDFGMHVPGSAWVFYSGDAVPETHNPRHTAVLVPREGGAAAMSHAICMQIGVLAAAVDVLGGGDVWLVADTGAADVEVIAGCVLSSRVSLRVYRALV